MSAALSNACCMWCSHLSAALWVTGNGRCRPIRAGWPAYYQFKNHTIVLGIHYKKNQIWYAITKNSARTCWGGVWHGILIFIIWLLSFQVVDNQYTVFVIMSLVVAATKLNLNVSLRGYFTCKYLDNQTFLHTQSNNKQHKQIQALPFCFKLLFTQWQTSWIYLRTW